MHKPWTELFGTVLKNVAEVKLKNEQLAELKREHAKPSPGDLYDADCHLVVEESSNPCYAVSTSEVSTKIEERLRFSRYLIDPNRHKFAQVVRLVAIVMRFCRVLLLQIGRDLKRFPDVHPPVVDCDGFVPTIHTTVGLCLTDQEIQHALNYYFKKTTEELKSYAHPKSYENDSYEKVDILYYTGRVLNSDITYECDMTAKMLDLAKDTFVVPIIDRYSPVAYRL